MKLIRQSKFEPPALLVGTETRTATEEEFIKGYCEQVKTYHLFDEKYYTNRVIKKLIPGPAYQPAASFYQSDYQDDVLLDKLKKAYSEYKKTEARYLKDLKALQYVALVKKDGKIMLSLKADMRCVRGDKHRKTVTYKMFDGENEFSVVDIVRKRRIFPHENEGVKKMLLERLNEKKQKERVLREKRQKYLKTIQNNLRQLPRITKSEIVSMISNLNPEIKERMNADGEIWLEYRGLHIIYLRYLDPRNNFVEINRYSISELLTILQNIPLVLKRLDYERKILDKAEEDEAFLFSNECRIVMDDDGYTMRRIMHFTGTTQRIAVPIAVRPAVQSGKGV